MGKKSKSRQSKSEEKNESDNALRETLNKTLTNLYAFHRDIIFPTLFEKLRIDLFKEIEFECVVEDGRCYIDKTHCWLGNREDEKGLTLEHTGMNRDSVSSHIHPLFKQYILSQSTNKFKFGFFK